MVDSPAKAHGGWTDAEKLLFAILDAQSSGPIPWNKVQIPHGRTVKACTHVVAKLKHEAAGASAAESPTKSTPGGTKTKKRAIEADTFDMSGTSTPSTPTKKTMTKKAKSSKSGSSSMADGMGDLFADVDGTFC